jgi:hypothetical protein
MKCTRNKENGFQGNSQTHKLTNTQTSQVIIRANLKKDCHVQLLVTFNCVFEKEIVRYMTNLYKFYQNGISLKPGEDTISLSSVLYRKIVFIWEMKMKIKFHQTMKFKF